MARWELVKLPGSNLMALFHFSLLTKTNLSPINPFGEDTCSAFPLMPSGKDFATFHKATLGTTPLTQESPRDKKQPIHSFYCSYQIGRTFLTNRSSNVHQSVDHSESIRAKFNIEERTYRINSGNLLLF